MGRTLDGSEPDWEFVAPTLPPEGAPNILLVLTDDAGFGNPSTFGGPIRTPTLDRLAGEGLKYNRFHTTALCSPTRAALMTGRNHHSVGFGMVGEFAGPFPGYSAQPAEGLRSRSPKTLQGNGYSTACFGKWHLTPDNMQGPAGPFDRWPNAVGFDYFWGFLGRRVGPVRPGHHREQHGDRRAGASEDFYLPGRDGRQDDRVAARRARARLRQAVVRLLLDRRQPRAASGAARSGPTSTRARSTRAGTSCARRRSRGRRSSA